MSTEAVPARPASVNNEDLLQMTASDMSLTLEDVVKDAHMQSVFLQYLSAHDKKGFARLLFLVSVDEFKKLLGSGDTFEEDVASVNRRVVYASKIVSKFMSKDSFLDIASENLRILNKSVWSFGSFLRNDLMMCSSLSSKVDLFHDAEVAVKKALQPSFQQFGRTKEYAELVRSARIGCTFFAGAAEATIVTPEPSPCAAVSTDEPPVLPSPIVRESSYLTLQRVLGNRRLCSVFWVFLFKDRTHQQLSLWMDFRYNLLPLLNGFISAVSEDDSANEQSNDEEQPGEMIDQILTTAGRICHKYVAVGSSAEVTFVADADRELLLEFGSLVAYCLEGGSFSLADAETMVKAIERLSEAVEANLRVNHFVRFMGSDSFKSLVSCYQSRLLSPSASTRHLETAEEALSSSASSDCSMTTLQELFHCMNVASHQPQRIRSKKFSLRDMYHSQLRGERGVGSNSLISSVLTFKLDSTDKQSPIVMKNVLFALARDSDLRHHHAIPDHVESFFCPAGAEVIRAKTRPEPRLFHMTIGNAEKAFYGACLTRYVPQDDDSQLGPLELVLREEEGLQVYVPVGVCIISRYPVLDTLKKRLEELYVEMEQDEAFLNDPDWKPAEAQMQQLLSPFDFGRISEVTASGSLDRYVDFSMEELFNCLSIENVVTLATCLMLERQVVLVSSKYSVLTCVGETLKSLISPLVWSHVFAPILPKCMLECLQCPTPYLFGVHSSYRTDLNEMLAREGSCENIMVVDLDANTLSSRVRPLLPEFTRMSLITELQKLLKPRVYFSDYVPMCQSVSAGPRRFPERRVRECFERCIRQLLDQLEEFRFVLSDDFDFVVVFDRVGYMTHLPIEEKPFFCNFLETQVFSHQIASVA
ncbi:TPA: hypothetical protein N0F65_011192 [Lagenidium giganteum]|uniref:UDENN domain-containing protein n=1 Tax=Lagenidium giganteum TaxID=4803 RepID=A0AAV2Z8J2_9STRA|nr:TPA: hypothetical protein N0F65_011192 [Lagenidium giganteum]